MGDSIAIEKSLNIKYTIFGFSTNKGAHGGGVRLKPPRNVFNPWYVVHSQPLRP
jgi:hypothetical protein